MKKVLKNIGIFVVFLFLYLFFILIYVGNYFYDYTLNSYSDKNILEKIPVNENKRNESREWLNNHSEDVYIVNEKLELHSYFIKKESSVYIIMVHGYRSDATGLISPIKKLQKQNYNLLIPDLRGHGKSDGDYIGMGWHERYDIIKWIDYILSQNQDAQIILYGVSMGGATVMNVAGEKLPSQVKGIIEDCGYTSVYDIVNTHLNMNDFENQLTFKMVSLITYLRAGYQIEDVKPIEQVKKSQTPLLFIHGDKDQLIPVSMMNELYNATKCEKEKLLIKGANHTGSYSTNSQLYYRTINEFINKYVD